MGYARSFRQLRTHVLCSALPSGSLAEDRALVYEALGAGRCYIAVDALAPARGFSFWASDGLVMGGEAAFAGQTLHAQLPRPAELRLVKDGVVVASVAGAGLECEADGPGVYRVEGRLRYRGRSLTWIVSNPIYLRG
jgi:stage V sporulation protein SpoVS